MITQATTNIMLLYGNVYTESTIEHDIISGLCCFSVFPYFPISLKQRT